MKKLLVVLMLCISGCSSAPAKKLMKNCEQAGSGSSLYYCEEIPEKEIGGRNR